MTDELRPRYFIVVYEDPEHPGDFYVAKLSKSPQKYVRTTRDQIGAQVEAALQSAQEDEE
jgi:hypothetical protein